MVKVLSYKFCKFHKSYKITKLKIVKKKKMSVGVGQVLLLVLFGLVLFGNPSKQLRDLGKGLRGFISELQRDKESSEPIKSKKLK